MRRYLIVAALIATGCAHEDPPPPWDQKAQFEQATSQIAGVRIVDRRLLAWTTEVRDSAEPHNYIRLDHALLWFEVSGSSKGRYLVVPAYRTSLSGDDKWKPSSAIADDFINGKASIVWRYEYFTSSPSSEDLIRMGGRILFASEGHVMPRNWQFVTGETPPSP